MGLSGLFASQEKTDVYFGNVNDVATQNFASDMISEKAISFQVLGSSYNF